MRVLTISIGLLAMWALIFSTLSLGQSRLVSTWQATPLSRAVLNGDAEGVKQELSRGSKPNERDPGGQTPLHQAMFARTEIAKILLDAHADPNIRTADVFSMPSNHWTPLFYAVTGGRTDLVKLLLEHGASVNVTDLANRTPLYYAVAGHKTEIADLLIKAGAQPLPLSASPVPSPKRMIVQFDLHRALQPHVSVPQLYQAVTEFDAKKVEALLNDGADPNERSPSGHAPLHEAMKCDPEICRLLLNHGADPNIRVKNLQGNDWTPIFFAAYDGRGDLISELLRHGAKVNVTDAFGKSPLWYAENQKKNKAAELLRGHQSDTRGSAH